MFFSCILNFAISVAKQIVIAQGFIFLDELVDINLSWYVEAQTSGIQRSVVEAELFYMDKNHSVG